jgi:signal peptidase I
MKKNNQKPLRAPASKPRGFFGSILSRENIEAIVIAIVLALFIRTFIVQAFKIPSGSMQPTLLIGDHILVNKFLYGVGIPFTDIKLLDIKKPARGDVIVFIYPEDESKDYIKRVIGLPGDTIQIIDKQIFLNGSPYHDSVGVYVDPVTLRRGLLNSNRDNFGPVTVPPNALFVMGDNRDHSADSRFWGFVNINKVRGKAFIIYWSWESAFKNFRFSRIGSLIK